MLKPLLSKILITLILCLSSSVMAQADKQNYTEIEWVQLMPKEDLDALLNPPEEILNIQDGSAQDSLSSLEQMSSAEGAASKYYDALKSNRIVESFRNKSIKVPGFIVPLASDEEQQVTEFFIVPFFGACLHMPPPPPNQMIYAKLDKGFKLESLYQPYWFEGTLGTESMDHSLGSSAYSINLDSFYVYEE